MSLTFSALVVDADEPSARITLGDRDYESSEHYFTIQRTERRPSAESDSTSDIYIEFDDQSGGGYGGIERIIVTRQLLTVSLGEKWKVKFLCDREIVIALQQIKETDFSTIVRVLKVIMAGYDALFSCQE